MIGGGNFFDQRFTPCPLNNLTGLFGGHKKDSDIRWLLEASERIEEFF
jgi:hypothetical protein